MGEYRIVIPVYRGQHAENWVRLAQHLLPAEDGHIDLIGIVEVPLGHSLSEGALQAQECREELVRIAEQCAELPVRISPHVWVSHAPWLELLSELQDEPADLLLVPWVGIAENVLGVRVLELLAHAPCDVILVQGTIHRYDRVLMPVRGTAHLPLRMRLAYALHRLTGEPITILHVQDPGGDRPPADPLTMIEEMRQQLPFPVELISEQGEPAQIILEHASAHHALVLGATLSERLGEPGLSAVHESVISQSLIPVFLVRSFGEQAELFERIALPHVVITSSELSAKVDRWFATNTFHWSEFEDVRMLLQWKERSGQTISLALPALNEEKTVGRVIEILRSALMEEYPLLDEIVLIDSNSTDRTREIAQELGIPVYIHQEILRDEVGSAVGKGEALWKSLYVTKGDIIVWIDTDIVNIHPRFVLGVVGPLLRWDRIQYVKGFYRRPLREGEHIRAGGGGRVTELVARPLLNLFFPELSGLIQPLSGEYAGRRRVLERVPFFTGYGVESGLLIDLLELCGLNAIAQTDLEMRVHHNQPLSNLSKMAFAIIQVFMARLGQRLDAPLGEAMHRTMKIICQEPGRMYLTEEEITERERPPMLTVPAYRRRFGRSAEAALQHPEPYQHAQDDESGGR